MIKVEQKRFKKVKVDIYYGTEGVTQKGILVIL